MTNKLLNQGKWFVIPVLLLLLISTVIQIDKSITIRRQEGVISDLQTKVDKLLEFNSILKADKDNLVNSLNEARSRFEENRIEHLNNRLNKSDKVNN